MRRSERGFFMWMMVFFLTGIILLLGSLYGSSGVRTSLAVSGILIVIIVLLAIVYKKIAY